MAISPVALAAVKRIDALFDIERDISGLSAEERLRVRQEQSAPILAALEAWLREEHSRLSRSAVVSTIFRTFDQATASVCTTCG